MQGFLSSIVSLLAMPRPLAEVVSASRRITALAAATHAAATHAPSTPSSRFAPVAGRPWRRSTVEAPLRAPTKPGAAAGDLPSGVLEPIGDDDLTLFGRAPAEPAGVRVVPYRPPTAWPEGRLVHPRVYDPFRAFPRRGALLTELICPRTSRDGRD